MNQQNECSHSIQDHDVWSYEKITRSDQELCDVSYHKGSLRPRHKGKSQIGNRRSYNAQWPRSMEEWFGLVVRNLGLLPIVMPGIIRIRELKGNWIWKWVVMVLSQGGPFSASKMVHNLFCFILSSLSSLNSLSFKRFIVKRNIWAEKRK